MPKRGTAMTEWSSECIEVLELLRDNHNVLIKGPPGTGKTRLLQEVARAFVHSSAAAPPVHVPAAKVSIPAASGSGGLAASQPSPERTDRKVFNTVFHQNAKHREFITGLVPVVHSSVGASGPSATGTQFVVQEGTLFRASQHAKSALGASLLVIDEINRGPAVQLFGGALVPFEKDKRLLPDGSSGPATASFELVAPPTGALAAYQLPFPLYTLAAMNEADTSVEALDVAFLRRWRPYVLRPNPSVLYDAFGVPNDGAQPPATSSDPSHVYLAAIAALSAVNERIRKGRGSEFQIGHGVLLGAEKLATTVEEAASQVYGRWTVVQAHIEEVFFGDMRAVAAVLGVGLGSGSHPFQLEEHLFADEVRFELTGPADLGPDTIYAFLIAVASDQ